jgi:hypothetical protein
MKRYEIVQGTVEHRVRVADIATGETVSLSGRLLDNMSYTAAAEILVLLERRDGQRMQQRQGALERNDLQTILDFNRRPER